MQWLSGSSHPSSSLHQVCGCQALRPLHPFHAALLFYPLLPLASCFASCLLPLFFSFCLLPLASPYLPVFHSFRRWPPGTCRTAPNSPDLSVVSHHSWTPGLLEAHGAARSVWKRRETRSTHLRYLYLYLCLTLPYPPYLTGPTYLYRPRPRPRPRLARVRHPTTRFVLARTRPFPSIRIHSGRMPPLQAQQLSH